MTLQQNLDVNRLGFYATSFRQALGKNPLPLVMAGGAVRDTINKRKVKDFDFFVNVPDWEDDGLEAVEAIERVVEALNKQFYAPGEVRETVRVGDADNGASDCNGYDIHSVWHWEHGYNDMPVDVVFIRGEVAKAYDAFDFALCQALVSPLYGLRTTTKFQRDVCDKTITYIGTDEGRDRSKIHLGHFLAKYAGWKVRGIAPLAA